MIPESIIMETTEYKSLQSKFSVVYNDSLTVRQAFEETKNQLNALRNSHLKTTEHLEVLQL